MVPRKLSYKNFLKSLELCPRLTVELLVENRSREIILVKRDRPPFENYWHVPGGFLLKGETIEECSQRLSKEELGIEIGKGKFLGIFENINGDPRGHILHYVLKFKTRDILTSHHFFKNLPESIIPFHKDFLNKLGYQ